MPVKQQFLTVRQAAKRLDVSPNTVRTWGASGRLPEYRHPLNNYRLFKKNDVERLRHKLEQPVRQTPVPAKKKR
jgi:DNA (cytosine-5)-methyltransferase 1